MQIITKLSEQKAALRLQKGGTGFSSGEPQIPSSSFNVEVPTSSAKEGSDKSSSSVKAETNLSSSSALFPDNSNYSNGTITNGRDDNSYKTVQIGTQIWMAENLNYEVDNSYCYNDSATNCYKYGRFYTWEAAKIVCPEGYHLPSNDEWEVLIDFVIDDNNRRTLLDVGTYLKSKTGWNSHSFMPAGIDKYGFNGLPAGIRDTDGSYKYIGEYGDFWSSSWYDSYDAHFYTLEYDSEGLYLDSGRMMRARSVRCIKDSN